MEVTFSEGGTYKFACYRLTYEESKSPDRIAKIKADLASKGKDGYSIAITCDASPTPPTWDTFANSLLCLDGRLEMWKLMQESWPHHKAVEAQKGVSKMSTSYFIFTEVQVNDQWHCINPQVMKLLPIEHLVLVPTLRSDSRYQFEKAYRQLECDGHPFTVDEMSRNLQASVNDWLTPEDSVRIAVCYDDILKLLNTSGKEHSAFALRSEVAAFQNDESDNILDFVSVDEYRKMEDELKKAYQYFEWNDRSGAYRYYEEIQKKVAAQVKDWKAINPRAEITSVRIMLFQPKGKHTGGFQMQSNKESNQKLIERFPFLIPRNRWTGKIPEDYDYSYTELDSMPDGWRKAFGEQMCEDIREELVRAEYLDQYRITQIKEKYGTLCWYDFGCTERMLRDIIPKYERLSARTCIRCGNPATKASTGWISPYCDTCAGKISHAERFIPIEEWLSGSGDEVASERIVNEKDTHSL